jgi:hypothetical protein
LAQLAQGVAAAEHASPQAVTQRLLGVAHWVLGHRGAAR